jgi:hypothetical protein
VTPGCSGDGSGHGDTIGKAVNFDGSLEWINDNDYHSVIERTPLRRSPGKPLRQTVAGPRMGQPFHGTAFPAVSLFDPTSQDTVDSTTDARWLSPLGRFFSRPWLGVLSRSLAAIFGGYALAATCSMFFAVALPGARAEAVLTGMLVGILLCASAALWAFATRSALRAWVGIALPTTLFWLGTLAMGPRALGAGA